MRRRRLCRKFVNHSRCVVAVYIARHLLIDVGEVWAANICRFQRQNHHGTALALIDTRSHNLRPCVNKQESCYGRFFISLWNSRACAWREKPAYGSAGAQHRQRRDGGGRATGQLRQAAHEYPAIETAMRELVVEVDDVLPHPALPRLVRVHASWVGVTLLATSGGRRSRICYEPMRNQRRMAAVRRSHDAQITCIPIYKACRP